ncbi:P-loop containing nucleoside triphosphate hydrolase protein [Coemansia reversa NRRL 1564]|uniref:P-loop containing nucleoside triphosphate hydrolase protein n=1 Tax=Coemansia reversa (strain ATCC 12441 / NRRL 1564) TaxID=763665 RepID=A0A2G5BK89_COERN|nr:P-loop containing nucleoside triphosphate hydrolase protein [Coemansia reversa NRRL 1564]|eukprot:PIA19419.1 P-loop containing nucleoside triphosphate hydrolase protein [Coemansia reversa NRRL 1564]
MSDVIVFGLSGPSCSGKTTIALNLVKLFPQTVVIHQDDFYKPDSQIPFNKEIGIQDWDCPEAFDMEKLVNTIQETRERLEQHSNMRCHDDDTIGKQFHYASQWANPPEDVDSAVSSDELESTRQFVLESLGISSAEEIPFSVILLDGILLFHDRSNGCAYPGAECNAGLLVFARRHTLRQRREARSGYTTKEGIWEDPPEYFDAIVWPNFIKYHSAVIRTYPNIVNDTVGGLQASKQQHQIDSIVVCSSDDSAQDTLHACVKTIIEAWKRRK